MNHVTEFLTQFPASSYYHALAFLSTAFLTQYSVQLIKVLTKYKLSKSVLRFLNGTMNTLFVAAGALVTSGGLSLGKLTVTSAALSTFSAVIYRLHSNYLYQKVSAEVTEAVAEPDKEIPQFAS